MVYSRQTPNHQTYGNRKDNEKGNKETAKENLDGKTRGKESEESDEVKKQRQRKQLYYL